MRLAALFRLTALGLALLCWLDPPSTIAPPPQVVVDAAIVHSQRSARPARDGAPETIADEARRLAQDMARALGHDGAVRVHEVEADAPLPCDALQPCVVFTEGAPVAVPLDRKGPLTLVLQGEPLAGNVDVARLTVEPAHLDGQAMARVSLTGQGLQGRTSRVRLLDGAAVVGEAAHTWSSDGAVTVDVPWWPVSAGSRLLTVRADTDGGGEVTTIDNQDTATADVVAEPWPVIVLERRPSWSATFIRRALEADRRFELSARTDVAPRIAVASNGGVLDGQRLDRARVVVVGAPDALTADDVARLESYVRQRGGAVVLAPDRPLSGAVGRLVHHTWRERIEDAPSAAGGLRASEWLVAGGVTPLDRVWVESPHGPVVVSSPLGAGVVLVSGALDAWRHRGDDAAFDQFWSATVAGLANAVGNTVDVDLVNLAPHSGGDLRALVRARTVSETRTWQASATRTCDDGETAPLRLWPADAAGAFEGRVPIGARTGCRVVARVSGLGEATAALADGPTRGSSHRWTQSDMESLATRTGGVVVTNGDLRPVVQAWLDGRGAERKPEPRYPMRSWWWLVPLTTCLAAEWWLRRRAGLR